MVIQLDVAEQAELMHFLIDCLATIGQADKEELATDAIVDDPAAILVHKIKSEAPSADFDHTYHQLLGKSSTQSLTKEEQVQLREMVTISEAWTVKRLGYLIQLSQLWKMSVDEVMQKLDIKTPAAIHG